MPDQPPHPPDSESEFLGETLPALVRPVFSLRHLILSPGECISGRFEIVESVGQGGMGQVYLVNDRLRSGQKRALKVILPTYSQDPEFTQRFITEVGAALNISHPNVCRVYDLDVDSTRNPPLHFYTMEYLAGETLSERLARDPPASIEQAFSVLRGIAAGLDAAHQRNIVHRDLKPANIMLVNGDWDRPVLMDFGLAKKTDERGFTTKTSDRLGTPAYMAPEQFTGASATPAMDVYAFALIVNDLVTTHHTAKWQNVLNRGLSRDPAKRYASAGEMVRELEAAAKWTKKRRTFLWWGISTAGLSLSGLGIRFLSQDRLSAVPLIMIAPVTETLYRPSAVSSATAFERVLAYEIGRSDQIAIVTRERVEARWTQLRSPNQTLDESAARLVARAEGAPFVLFALINEIAGQLQVQLRLEASGHLARRRIIDFNNIDELPIVARETAAWIRGELSRPGLNPRDPGMPELTTTKWAALEQYVAGDEAWRHGKAAEAILHLEEAIQVDPDFAAAEARLGDLLLSQQEMDSGYLHWSRAASLARQRALTTKELLRIRGLFAADTGDADEAERAFAVYNATYPDDPIGYFYRASATSEIGQIERAVELSAQAVRLAPKNYTFAVQLARLMADQGDLNGAWETLNRARPLESGEGWIDQSEAGISFARRQYDEHERALVRISQSHLYETMSRGFSLIACLRAAQQRPDEARAQLADGLAFDKARGFSSGVLLKTRLLAQLALSNGERARAGAYCQEMLAMAKGTIERLKIGCLLARSLPDPHLALKLDAAAIPKWPIYEHWSLRLKAEAALASGEGKKALRIFNTLPYNADPHEFPEYLLRAADAAKDEAAVLRTRQLFQRFSVRYVTEPEHTGIGSIGLFRKLAESPTKKERKNDQAKA